MQILGILITSADAAAVWEGSKITNLHCSVVLQTQNNQLFQQPQCILYIAKPFTKSHSQNEGLLFCLIFCCVALNELNEAILLPYVARPEGKNRLYVKVFKEFLKDVFIAIC
jgi:hypothetical protein